MVTGVRKGMPPRPQNFKDYLDYTKSLIFVESICIPMRILVSDFESHVTNDGTEVVVTSTLQRIINDRASQVGDFQLLWANCKHSAGSITALLYIAVVVNCESSKRCRININRVLDSGRIDCHQGIRFLSELVNCVSEEGPHEEVGT